MTVVTQPQSQQEENVLLRSSRKIIAIGAGFGAWLRAVDKIVFSKEPTHVPDQKVIDDVVRLLSGEQTTKKD